MGLSKPDLLREEAYVNGAWQRSNDTLSVFDPATGSEIGVVPNLGHTEAEAAVGAAYFAQKSWARLTGKERGTKLRHWAKLMLENCEDLARIMTFEQGKPLAEARGEVAYASSFLEWFAEEARRVNGEILTPHQNDRRILVRKEPIGVVAAITPWNFPLAMITRKAGPALAVGCSMVLRPAELTPFSALALAKLSEEAGIPPGVFNVVTGRSRPIGEVLTSDKRIRKFTFTGSTEVGKLLAAKCAATVKRVSLELGGNAPFLIFEDADLDLAVEAALISKFRNAGQTCVCVNRFLVQTQVFDSFAARLAERVKDLVVGPGLSDETTMGPLIDDRAIAKSADHVADAVARGGQILAGGNTRPGPGHFFEPTVITEVRRDAKLCHEETFGPIAGLVRFDTEAEAIDIANDTDAGLAAYIFTRDLDRSFRVSEALEYGMIGLNTGIISTEVAPFGGVKESGNGREGSSHGVDDYLELKMVCIGVSGKAAEPVQAVVEAVSVAPGKEIKTERSGMDNPFQRKSKQLTYNDDYVTNNEYF
jgi:succinate-semialdehyde dehydrogenase / glutarate-semialdehyde dehydrogenase